MAKVSLEVYLYFQGNCREAMEFYKSVFGGELNMTTVGDSPSVPGMPEIDKDWIMHAALEGGDVKLMASDTPNASDKAAKVDLSLGGTDEEYMRGLFNKLSKGGTIMMPLEKQFWGDIFGSFTDKYNISWNMNIRTQADSKN